MTLCLCVKIDHVASTATGHQRSEGRNAGSSAEYLARRKEKLEGQLAVVRREVEEPSSVPREGKAEAGDEDGGSQEEGIVNPNVLRNVRAYIDGFLENTTDIEMKRIITQAGGEVLYVFSLFLSLSPS